MVIQIMRPLQQLMNNYYYEIVQTLKMLQTESVNKAEHALNSMKDNPSFLEALILIMKDSTLQQNVKLSASILVCSILEETYVYSEDRVLFPFIYQILTDVGITNDQKRCLERVLIKSMEKSSAENLGNYKQLAIHLIQQGLLNPAYLIIGCFGASSFDSSDPLISLVKDIYEFSLQNIQLALNYANDINQLVKAWVVVFDKLLSIKQSQFILLQICNSKSLMKLIDWILMLESREDNLVCRAEGLHELNFLKFQATQLFYRVLNYGLINKTASEAFEYLLSIHQRILATLSIRSFPDSYSIDFAICLVKIIIIFFKHYPNQKQQFWVNICELIIYPLLEANEQERSNFQDDYEEFNLLLEDCCHQQASGVLKTQIAKLLQTLGDTIKDTIEYSINRALYSIKQQFGHHIQTQNLIKIQTAFLILSIFSYHLSKLPQQVSQIRKIILEANFSKMNEFQIARMFQFLGYNYTDLFSNPSDGEEIIQKALKYKGHPTTAICGLDFISNIANEYYTDEFFKIISDKVVLSQHPIIWQIISKVIYSHHNEISQPAMCYLVNQIFKRIDIENQQLQSKSKTQTFSLINCLHLMRRIIEKKSTESKFVIKEQIWKITDYLLDACNYSVEDQIISIISEYFRNNTNNLQPFIDILPRVLITFEQQGFMSLPYFVLLNQYICNADIQTLNSVFHILLKGLKHHIDTSQVSRKNKQKVIIGNHLILLQNFLANLGTQMKKQEFEYIYKIGKELLPNQIDSKLEKVIVSRSLNLLFLCYMHHPNEEILKLLQIFHQKKVFQSYDANVILLCLEKQLLRQSNPLVICQMLSIMVKINAQLKKVKTNKKLKLKHERIQLYEVLLKSITVPFQTFLTGTQIIEKVIKVMKSNNSQLYTVIVSNMKPETKQLLSDILKIQKVEQSKPRVILKVIAAKNYNIQEEEINLEQNQSGNEDSNDIKCKRQRVKAKRQKK